MYITYKQAPLFVIFLSISETGSKSQKLEASRSRPNNPTFSAFSTLDDRVDLDTERIYMSSQGERRIFLCVDPRDWNSVFFSHCATLVPPEMLHLYGRYSRCRSCFYYW